MATKLPPADVLVTWTNAPRTGSQIGFAAYESMAWGSSLLFLGGNWPVLTPQQHPMIGQGADHQTTFGKKKADKSYGG